MPDKRPRGARKSEETARDPTGHPKGPQRDPQNNESQRYGGPFWAPLAARKRTPKGPPRHPWGGPPKQRQTKTQRPLTAPNKNPKTLNKKRRKRSTVAREYVRAPRPHHIQTQRADRDEPVDASTSEGVSRTAAGALQPTVTCAKICFCTPTHGSKGVQAIYAPPLPATTSNAAQHHAPDTTEHIKA